MEKDKHMSKSTFLFLMLGLTVSLFMKIPVPSVVQPILDMPTIETIKPTKTTRPAVTIPNIETKLNTPGMYYEQTIVIDNNATEVLDYKVGRYLVPSTGKTKLLITTILNEKIDGKLRNDICVVKRVYNKKEYIFKNGNIIIVGELENCVPKVMFDNSIKKGYWKVIR